MQKNLLFFHVIFITVINDKICVSIVIVHGILGGIGDNALCNSSSAPRKFLRGVFNFFELMNGLCDLRCGLGERPRNLAPAVIVELHSNGRLLRFCECGAFTLGCINSVTLQIRKTKARTQERARNKDD